MEEFLIGLDVGTTAIKAVAFDRAGKMLGRGAAPLLTVHPQPGWSEQDPQLVWLAMQEAMRQLLAQLPNAGVCLAVGLSTAMHSLVLLDEGGQPLTKFWLWSDNRAAEVAQRLRQDGLGQALHRENGAPIHPMLPLCKLLWVREQHLGFDQPLRVGSLKDWLYYQLCGEALIDPMTAAASGLYHLESRDWDEAIALGLLGLRRNHLPCLAAPETQVPLDAAAAAALGLPAGTPIVLGGSDGGLANLGAGAFATREAVITVGTSGAVRIIAPAPQLDQQLRLFCYELLEGHYLIGGGTNNGGLVLDWLGRQFASGASAEACLALAAEAVADEDLLFLPYLQGERAPIYQPEARGVFFGLHHKHEPGQLLRAGLVGMTQALDSIGRIIAAEIQPLDGYTVGGGLAQSHFWLQMLADVTGKPIRTNPSIESSALGAAMIAYKAIGGVPTLEAVQDWAPTGAIFRPNAADHQLYCRQTARWERLYLRVRELFTEYYG